MTMQRRYSLDFENRRERLARAVEARASAAPASGVRVPGPPRAAEARASARAARAPQRAQPQPQPQRAAGTSPRLGPEETYKKWFLNNNQEIN